MKRILILLLGLFSVAYGQFSPTSAKTAFKWGVSIGTRDSTAYAANDSLVVVINRQGRMMYRSTDGYWKLLANAASSDFVPYTGAVNNVNLGNYRLTARSLKTDSIYANSSAGMYLTTNSGSVVAHWGGGGSVEVDFKGFAGYDANRAGSYTARSFTDKNYVDSSDGLRLLKSDSATYYDKVVRTFGTQTVGGNKTFSNDILVNGLTVGRGSGNDNQSAAVGVDALLANTTGVGNSAYGNLSLRANTSGTENAAFGIASSRQNTTGTQNAAFGSYALREITTGSFNTGLGYNAGAYLADGTTANATGSQGIYIGRNARASANGLTNETVIGVGAIGNGSNTVTIGNSSVTNNYFNGNIRSSNGTAFLKNMANGSSSDSVIVSNNGELRKIPQSSIVGSGGTVTSVSAGTGMSFTTITSTGAVNADTTTLATRAYVVGLDVGKANTSLNNVNGVLSSTYGGAGSVSGILKANGSGVVSPAVAGTDYVVPSALSGYLPLSGGTLTGALSGTSLSMSGIGLFNGAVDDGTNKLIVNGGVKGAKGNFTGSTGETMLVTGVTGENAARITGSSSTSNSFGLLIAAGTNASDIAFKVTSQSGLTDYLVTRGDGQTTARKMVVSGGSGELLSVNGVTGENAARITGSSSTSNSFGLLIAAGTNASDAALTVTNQDLSTTLFRVRGDGAATFSSSVTVGGALSFSPSSSKIVSGITDFAIRNNADNTSMLHFNNSTLAATFTGSLYGIGFRYAYAAKSSNYTLTDNDDYINVTSSCTITLPTAVGRSGKRYVIKCTGSAVATIASTSSQTIDGNAASTYSFGGPNFNIMIVYSDGSNWFLEAWQTGI